MKSKRPGSSKDVLCCCEYSNLKGETSHILACCCDCEAVDSVCDRCLTCKELPSSEIDRMFQVIEDRCRIPWCLGEGALQIKMDIAFPVIAIPLCTLIATINVYLSILAIVGLPCALLLFYRIWSTRPEKHRTRLFYVSGLTGVLQLYYIFETIVISFREIYLWENLLLTTLVVLMIYMLFLSKKDPGKIVRETDVPKSQQFHDQKEKLIKQLEEPSIDSTEKTEGDAAQSKGDVLHPAQLKYARMFIHNFQMDPDVFAKNWEDHKEQVQAGVLTEQRVTWVDSRDIKDGLLETFCKQCKIKKPARSGHCPVCEACIQTRDHHCVWIDTCIGARNHRAFFGALLLFVLSCCYGSHLTLTTVCTPEMFLDWFLYPKDCRYVYTEFDSALSFVSACYALIAALGMAFMLLEQIILISQNVTMQELHQANKRGWVKYGLFAKNNVNNRGCVRNWLDFLSGRRSCLISEEVGV